MPNRRFCPKLKTRVLRTIRIAGVLFAGAAIPALAGPPSAGTTVITHGFQFDGQRPEWPLLMAAEIAARVRAEGGLARVLLFEPDQDPALVVCADTAVCGTSDATGHAIVVMDWADLSNRLGRGFSEAAGEALTAVLLAEQAQLDLSNVHFIGHSRGPVVNSEAAERLIASGIAGVGVDQITVLDLHDWGVIRSADGVELAPSSGVRNPGAALYEGDDPGADRGGLDDFDVNELHPEYDCGLSQGGPSGACAWASVDYVDSYYQADGFFDLWGRTLQGASNLFFDGIGMGHSEVHCWYRTTVPSAGVLVFPGGDCTEASIDSSWFGSFGSCTSTDRDTPLDRNSDGFNFSHAANGAASRCPDGLPRQPVLFDSFTAEGVVNGDFEKESDAGWVSNGGSAGGSLQSQGDNQFVRLSSGDQRQHAWVAVPTEAWALSFAFRIEALDPSAELVVTAHPYGAPGVELWRAALSNTTEWRPVRAVLPEALAGQSVRLSFTNEADGASTAQVGIDSVQWAPTSDGRMFADGFNTGSTSAWSSSVP